MKNKKLLTIIMLTLLFLSCIPFNITTVPADGWALPSWNSFQTITINSSYIDNDLKNFPVLVVLDNSSGGFCFHDNGADIRFSNTDNDTLFYYEIESFNNSGDTYCWVNISETVTSGSDYSFLVYYNNSDASDNQSASNVWSNGYAGVWHLHDDFLDSTGNNNDGTNYGTSNVSGVVGAGQDFDDSQNDYVEMLHGDSMNIVDGTDYTMSCWVKIDSDGRLFSKTPAGDGGFCLDTFTDTNSRIRMFYGDDANDYGIRSDNNYNMSTWQYITVAVDVDSSGYIYINDSSVAASEDDTGTRDSDMSISNHFRLGRYDNSTSGEFNGQMDEVRLCTKLRNSSWIKAQFHSMNQTTGFMSFGSETAKSSNNAPELVGESPTNQTTGQTIQPTCNVTVSDSDGDHMDIEFYENTTGSWVLQESIPNAINGSYSFTYSNASSVNTRYHWRINITDGTNSNSSWYWFETSNLSASVNTTTNISRSYATLNGYVDGDDGQICRVRFQYCELNDSFSTYGSNTSWQTGMQKGDSFSAVVGPLNHSMFYTVRAQINYTGSTWINSTIGGFVLRPNNASYIPPGIYMTNYSNRTRFWVGGSSRSNQTLIRYKTSGYPTNVDDGTLCYNGTLGSVGQTSNFLINSTTSNLPYDTYVNFSSWHYRNWSYNGTEYHSYSYSPMYARVKTFSEAQNRVLTDAATSITNNSATFNANLSDDGGQFNWINFEYSTDTSYASNTSNMTGKTSGTHSQGVTGLSPGQLYYYRARANNSNHTIRGTDAYTREIFHGVFYSGIYLYNNPYFPDWVFKYNSTLASDNSTGTVFAGYSDINILYRYNPWSDSWTSWIPGVGGDLTEIDYNIDYHLRPTTNFTFNITMTDVSFLTEPVEPDNAVGVNGSTWVNLSWTLGNGANSSVVVCNTTAFPTTISEGTIVYNGTNNWYNHTSITGERFYSIWSYANWSNPSLHRFSSSYDRANGTASNAPPLSPPGSVNATNLNTCHINISWLNDANNNTYIEWNSSASWPRGSGNLLYNNSTSSFIFHVRDDTFGQYDPLHFDKTYYYQLWSFNWTTGNYSTTNTSVNDTVNTSPVVTTNATINPTNSNATIQGRIRNSSGSSTTYFGWDSVRNPSNVLQFNDPGPTGSGVLVGWSGYAAYGQTFTADGNHEINAVELYISETGSTSCPFYVSIRNTNTSGFPLTHDLAIGTAGPERILASETWVMFPLNTTLNLVSGTNYSIIGHSPNSTASAYYVWNRNNSGDSIPGNNYRLDYAHANSSNLQSINASDLYFRLINLSYGNTSATSTSNVGDIFSNNTQSLANGTVYYYRAYGNNSWGLGAGRENEFITEPAPPTGMTVLNGSNYINVSWTTGDGANTTLLVRNNTHYPDNINDGTQVYNGSLSYYNDTGIGGQFFYRAWSYANWSAPNLWEFSSNNDSVNGTAANSAPVISNENPTNSSTGIDFTPALNVTCTDSNADVMNATWLSNSSGSWVIFARNYSINTGVSIIQTNSNFSSNLTTYWWSVNLTDDITGWDNETYHFTTRNYFYPSPPSGIAVTTLSRSAINISWTNNGSNSTILEWNTFAGWALGAGNQLDNSTNTSYIHDSLSFGTTYYYQLWSWNSTDNVYSTTNSSGSNTTLFNQPCTITGENPSNNSINQPLSLIWNVTIYDTEGDTFNWTLECNNAQSNNSNNDVNGSKNLSLSGLVPNSRYTIWVNVSDSFGNTSNATFYFNTTANNAPNITGENPGNNSVGVSARFTPLNVTIFDIQGDTFNWTINCSTGDSNWNNSDVNGSKICSLTIPLMYETRYTWWVNVSDGYNSTNATFYFNTTYSQPPVITGENPGNNSVDQPYNFTWNVTINDPDGDTFNWTLECNNSQSNNANGESNGSKTLSLSGLASLHRYMVWVNVTDGYNTSNATYYFNTTANQPPNITGENPSNQSINIAIGFTPLNVTINDLEGNTFNWTIEASTGDSNWNNSDVNGSKICSLTTPLSYGTRYTWWVNASDAYGTSNATYWFNTTHNQPPALSGETPSNGTTGVSTAQSTVNVTIVDLEGHIFNWSIEVNNGDSNNATGDTNGSKSCSLTTPLSYLTQYIWWVNVSDSFGNTSNATYWFNTTSNNPPALSGETPSNQSINIALTHSTVNVTIVDIEGHSLNWTINVSNGDNNSANSDTNGSKSCTLTTPLSYGTTYTWWVNVSDGYNSTNATYWFNTTHNQPPTITGEFPTNNTIAWDIINDTINVTIFDPEGHTFNWTINVTSGDGNNSNTDNNGSKTCTLTTPLSHLTSYTWWVNVSDGLNTSNASYVFTTRNYYTPSQPSSFFVNYTSSDHRNLILEWVNSTNASYTYIERNTSSVWSRGNGTEVYNGTGDTYTDAGLGWSTNYTYQAWGYNETDNLYSSSNISGYNWTYPQPPQNTTSLVSGSTIVFTWDNGTGCDSTLIINQTDSYPANHTDGNEWYNGSLNTFTVTSFNNSDKYSLFTYNQTSNLYSNGADTNWGQLKIYVYKENEPWIGINNYSVFITNQNGSDTYHDSDSNNPTVLDVSQIPHGTDIAIQISADGYYTRTQYHDLNVDEVYNLSFYLPPSEEGGGTPGDDDYIPPEDSDTLYTDTEDVVDHTSNETVYLKYSASSISVVYVYNDSAKVWETVASTKYSVNYSNNTVIVDSSVLDANSTVIRVDYYYFSNETYARHYIITVRNELDDTVHDAFVEISRYINTTDSYNLVISDYTDGAGQISIDLIPDVRYMVNISATDYNDMTSFWTPKEIDYVEDAYKTFVLEFEAVTYPNETYPSDCITFDGYINTTSSVAYVNYTDSCTDTINTSVNIFEYNHSTNTSSVLFSTFNSSDNSFQHQYDINTSNSYTVVIYINHTLFGFFKYTFIYSQHPWGYDGDTLTSRNEFENIFSVLGSNQFGWSNIFGLLILMIGLFAFGYRNVGVAMVLTGIIMVAFQAVIGLVLITFSAWFLLILFGILVQWKVNRKVNKG